MSVPHPLSAEPTTTRRRNAPASSRAPTNYFSLKNASEQRAHHVPEALLVSPPSDLDVTVERESRHDDHTPSTAHPTDVGAATPIPRTPVFSLADGDGDQASQMVLSTRWHTLSDEEIQASVATLSSVQSPSEQSTHPYHDTIRILSAACDRLVRQAAALERARKSLQQQEARRKKAAERAVKDLKPGQRETGQQLLRAIYGLEPTESINNLNTTIDASKPPNSLPMSISEAMQDVWTPPPREPALQPSQPLDIPSASDAISFVSGSRSRASSFTPGSSIASHSIKSERTSASKTFLGGWFGRSVSRTSENDDQDADADVVSIASANVPATSTGNTTAKMMSGVFRKGRGVFNVFGIAPTPPSSTSTPPQAGTSQEQLEDHNEANVPPVSGISYTSSPTSKIAPLPFQAPLMSPILPANPQRQNHLHPCTRLSTSDYTVILLISEPLHLPHE
ncbi:Rab-GTPase-TBC domain protein [Ceratobasidium sp. AG-Ba]|nr:Rab-GTPase-TBC domain protein [Ceratobasidium sp. AG-Ba]